MTEDTLLTDKRYTIPIIKIYLGLATKYKDIANDITRPAFFLNQKKTLVKGNEKTYKALLPQLVDNNLVKRIGYERATTTFTPDLKEFKKLFYHTFLDLAATELILEYKNVKSVKNFYKHIEILKEHLEKSINLLKNKYNSYKKDSSKKEEYVRAYMRTIEQNKTLKFLKLYYTIIKKDDSIQEDSLLPPKKKDYPEELKKYIIDGEEYVKTKEYDNFIRKSDKELKSKMKEAKEAQEEFSTTLTNGLADILQGKYEHELYKNRNKDKEFVKTLEKYEPKSPDKVRHHILTQIHLLKEIEKKTFSFPKLKDIDTKLWNIYDFFNLITQTYLKHRTEKISLKDLLKDLIAVFVFLRYNIEPSTCIVGSGKQEAFDRFVDLLNYCTIIYCFGKENKKKYLFQVIRYLPSKELREELYNNINQYIGLKLKGESDFEKIKQLEVWITEQNN